MKISNEFISSLILDENYYSETIGCKNIVEFDIFECNKLGKKMTE